MKVKKDELIALYNDMTAKELAKYLNISQPTLRTLLRENGITLKGKGNRTLKGVRKIIVE